MQLNKHLLNEIEYLGPNAEYNPYFDEINTDIVQDVIEATFPIEKSNYQAHGYGDYSDFVANELTTAEVGMLTTNSTLMDAITLYNSIQAPTKRVELLTIPQFEQPYYRFFLIHHSVDDALDRDLFKGTGNGQAIADFLAIINQH